MKYLIAILLATLGIACRRHVRGGLLFAYSTLVVAFTALPGCALVPMSMQAQEQSSIAAEGTWLALDAVDTMQTVQIAKNPRCYIEADPLARMVYGTDHPSVGKVVAFNFLLAVGHTMVTSWLDDEVAKHEMANDGSVGPWYVGRITWHVLSIVGTGTAVASNYHLGLTPTSSRGCP